MLFKTILFSVFIGLLLVNFSFAQEGKINVLSYHLTLKPDIREEVIEGNIKIQLSINSDAREVVLNCGDLIITEVKGEFIKGFKQKKNKVFISLKVSTPGEIELQLFYYGRPTRGVVFFDEPLQMHTVFSTSQWMPCNDDPSDRATIKMDLIIPENLKCVASGIIVKKDSIENNLVKYSWVQDYATPSYTYGFAIGSFKEFHEKQDNISLDYYSPNHTSAELKAIFDKSADMLRFFEDKSGVPYVQSSYTQLLLGNYYQEMSGFSLLKNSYGDLVLKDSTETNLISHELAHQWWGNMITCESWKHFWLNEGFATFMSAAYNERRFRREKYDADIAAYYKVYEGIVANGADKSLVFKDWLNPTSDDRNLVYFKGAYVLHLLREEMGEKEFWQGIKTYSQKYYGKSVNTEQFQNVMEQSSGKNLNKFFEKWVYGNTNAISD